MIKKINELKPDLLISTYWTGLLSPCYYIINKLVSNKIKKIGIIHNVISHEKRFSRKKTDKIILKWT